MRTSRPCSPSTRTPSTCPWPAHARSSRAVSPLGKPPTTSGKRKRTPTSAQFTIQRLDDETGAAIGDVGLWRIDLHHRSAHVGISLLPAARGQGLGRDAVEVIIRYAFQIRGLARLSLETLDLNTAMRATATACGFVEEGRLRSASWHLGRRMDEVLYGLLANEWHDHHGRPPGNGHEVRDST